MYLDGFLYFADPSDTDSAVLYAQLEVKLGKETVDLIRSLGKDRSVPGHIQIQKFGRGS